MKELLEKFKINKKIALFLAILLLNLGVVPFLNDRSSAEGYAKQYDIVLDYDEMAALESQSEHDLTYWLKNFKSQMGINKVALIEENLNSLNDNEKVDVYAHTMDAIAKEPEWKDNYPVALISMMEKDGFDKYDILVEIRDDYYKKFLFSAMKERFKDNQYKTFDDGSRAFILIDGKPKNALYTQAYKLMDSEKDGVTEKIDVIGSKIMFIGLGLLPEKVKLIKEAGCEVIPRTLCYNGFNGTKFAKAVVADYEKNGASKEYLIAGGEAIIGNDDGIKFAQNYVKKNDTKVTLIETTTQRGNIFQGGLNQLVIDNDYKAVRAFTVWNYIQYRYKFYGYSGAQEIENTFFRAITERNIRMIYFKPIKENQDLHTYVTNFKEYKQLFDNLDARLAKHGFERGSASVMERTGGHGFSMALLSLGIVLAVIALLSTLFELDRKVAIGLAVIGLLGLAMATHVMPNSFVLLLSFSFAVVFACLAITLFLSESRNLQGKLSKDASVAAIVKYAAVVLFGTVCLALIGGFATAAPLSNNAFMLEMEIFRGVKVAQLLPLMYFFVAFLAYFGFRYKKEENAKLEWHDLKEMLLTNVQFWMVILAGVLGAVGVYYIMRTGHDSSIEVSNVEMLFRNYLEDHLIARPRNKEFLFAFPAIMLAVYMFVRRQRLLALLTGLCGVIGLTSVINTFMHIRTPLYLGLARTGYSFVFGLILGTIAILVIDFGRVILKKCIKL